MYKVKLLLNYSGSDHQLLSYYPLYDYDLYVYPLLIS